MGIALQPRDIELALAFLKSDALAIRLRAHAFAVCPNKRNFLNRDEIDAAEHLEDHWVEYVAEALWPGSKMRVEGGTYGETATLSIVRPIVPADWHIVAGRFPVWLQPNVVPLCIVGRVIGEEKLDVREYAALPEQEPVNSWGLKTPVLGAPAQALILTYTVPEGMCIRWQEGGQQYYVTIGGRAYSLSRFGLSNFNPITRGGSQTIVPLGSFIAINTISVTSWLHLAGPSELHGVLRYTGPESTLLPNIAPLVPRRGQWRFRGRGDNGV
jgi:hypothetical protein